MKNFRVLFLVIFAATTSAWASDSSDGCGLGWQFTSKTSFSATTTRTTTNIFVPPTFGMTTGTLGCAQHSLVKKADEPAAIYAVENYDSLRQEMSEGRGENLLALSQLMGCDAGSYDSFAKMTQGRFRAIDDSASPVQFFVNVRSAVDQDSSLGSRCRI